MSQPQHPISDLDLVALITSKICHDIVGPVGAIYNGLEILDENDAASKDYALDVIRSVTEQASARLQFARLAFGAASATGAMLDLGPAELAARGFIGHSKHKLIWRGPAGQMEKDKVKLVLNLVACAVTALPRGGEIEVQILRQPDAPVLLVRCRGVGLRPPQHLSEFISGEKPPVLDVMTVQAYYTCRLAAAAGMRLAILKEGAEIILAAQSVERVKGMA